MVQCGSAASWVLYWLTGRISLPALFISPSVERRICLGFKVSARSNMVQVLIMKRIRL